MGYAAEALALLLLGALGWRIWHAGAGSAAHAAVGTVLALLVALLMAWGADALVALGSANLLVRLVVPLAVSVVAFALIRRCWRRAPRRRAAWSAALAGRPAAARAALALVLGGYTAFALLLIAVAVNLITRRWPTIDPWLRERTAVVGHLLVGTQKAVADDPVRVAMERQRRLAGGLGRLIANGRDAVADATGMGYALEAIDILREIGDLGYAERLWLVRNHPELARLVDNPRLYAVASDPAVLDDIERIARGSVAAAWRLGDRADIQNLVADPEMRAALAAIRLADLRAAWRARTAEGLPVPMAWWLGEADSSTLWSEEPAGLESFACTTTGTMLVARAALPGEDVARYRLVITGLEAPYLLVGHRPCALDCGPDGWSAEITVQVAGSDVELSVMAAPPVTGRFGLAVSQLR